MALSTVTEPQRYLAAQIRWQPIEIAFWLATLLPFVLTPNYLVLASQIAITALFALSNRMAHLTAMRPNDEFHLLGRVQVPSEGRR